MSKKYWSEEETQWLINNYPKYGATYCANHLNTGNDKISHKIYNLKKHGIVVLYQPMQGDYMICSKCKIDKPLTSYYKSKKGKNGLHATCKECFAKRDRERYALDTGFQLISRLRTRFKKFIKGESFSKNTELILGCTVLECKQHIEKQFTKMMSWDTEWHLDHIIPMELIKNNPENIHLILNYRNLQPLEVYDNLVKSNNLDDAMTHLLAKIDFFGMDSTYQKMINFLQMAIGQSSEKNKE